MFLNGIKVQTMTKSALLKNSWQIKLCIVLISKYFINLSLARWIYFPFI